MGSHSCFFCSCSHSRMLPLKHNLGPGAQVSWLLMQHLPKGHHQATPAGAPAGAPASMGVPCGSWLDVLAVVISDKCNP